MIKNKAIKNILLVIIFTVVIVSLRFLWIEYFSGTEQISIENGEVFLPDDVYTGQTVQLSGEWSFYPNELLEKFPDEDMESFTVNVPGNWSSAFDQEDPYGYGTYHLRLHVDPNENKSFSLRLYSVRSASKVYANGYGVGESGVVSNDESTYEAFNIPYNTYSIRADDDGIIDIFVQVANYVDPRSSGIVRSVYFGLEEELDATTDISTILQTFAGTVFIVHAILALIIYFVGMRRKEIIYFSLGLLSLALISLGGGDDKVLLRLFKMSYGFSYKLASIVLYLLAISILLSLKSYVDKVHRKIIPVFGSVIILATILTILTPIEHLFWADQMTIGSVFIAGIIAIYTLIRSKKSFYGGSWFVFALVAITNHFIWFTYTLYSGMKSMYYPFDLIIAIICLSTVWFKHYHDMNIELKIQTDRLAKADKEKDQFLANTSHELRNPLHSILNMSHAVLEREKVTLQRDSVKDLETVLSVSRRMAIQLNDLLEMTRLDGKKPQLHLREVSFPGVVEGVVHMLGYLVERKPIYIDNQLDENFPPVIGDENRIIQIMYNLIHNAIKYTDDGTIIIDGTVNGNIAHISVRDTGQGIDEETLSQLFLPYQQGKQPSYTEGGFGLGLYITKQLVEYQSGQIEVQSIVGEGSVFTITFPLAKTTDVHEAIYPKLDVQQRENILKDLTISEKNQLPMKNKQEHEEMIANVLVVDDDPINLRVIEVILQNEHYAVSTATSGMEALGMIDEKEYDLIITDVMMPHMSGQELAKKVRGRFSLADLPILLLTSRDRIRDIQHGFNAGANDYVTKPIEAEELKSRVKALTDVKRAARETLYLETAFLQAQIQPHFIFNTINSIFALSEIDIERMQKLLEAFSDVLRSKFQFRSIKRFVDIKEELQLIEAYLYIEKVRFGDRVQVHWHVDPDVKVKIPSITLQPLVENAILHGITQRRVGGTISISVLDHGKEIEVIVEDDGVGMSRERLEKLRNQERVSESGVGIYNTNIRLIRAYGTGLRIESEEGKGTKISFNIPK